MEKRVYAVRGAVFAENTKEDIQEKTSAIFNQAVKDNSIVASDIVSIQFSLTKDLDIMNPATALRLGKTEIDVSAAPLFCTQEAFIQGGRPKVIRLLLTAYLEKPPVPVYIGGAEVLRPDFAK